MQYATLYPKFILIIHLQSIMTNSKPTANEFLSRGICLHQQGKPEEALACYLQVLDQDPAIDIYLNIGAALHDLGQFDDALAAYQCALERDPASGRVYHNRGNTLLELDRYEEAIASYARAVQFMPDNAEALVTMGTAMEKLGNYTEAFDCYKAALARNPECAEAHWNLALLMLLQGRFDEGWREFEWRWRKKGYTSLSRSFDTPLWTGEALNGKTILIHTEQAFGDTIQFARYLPMVADRGGKVILECPAQLARLLETVEGVSRIIPAGSSLPRFDCHVPLMSLPLFFGTTLETIPTKVPYLSAPAECLSHWQRLLENDPHIKIGIVWAGRRKPDPHRSCQLNELAPLATIKEATFYTLQIGEGAEQAASPPPGMELVDLTGQVTDFADTAALIAQLDMIVSIDTAVAHLAGALGKPTFLLLPFAPDWRWMLERSDSPWYPSMRVFRQKALDAWQDPVARLTAELGAGIARLRWAQQHRGTEPSPIDQSSYEKACNAFDKGNFGEADQHLVQILDLNPAWVNALVMLGLCRYHLGKPAQAEQLFRQAITTDERCVEAYRGLGLLLNERKRYAESVDILTQGVSFAPRDAELSRFLANALYGEGNTEKAYQWYRRTLALRADDLEALINLGTTGELLNCHQEAETALLRAIDIAPGDCRPYLNLGGVYQSLNRLEEAEDCYLKAVEINREYGTAHWNLAQIDLMRGRYLEGFKAFETRFVKDDPVKVNLRGLPKWDGSSPEGRSILVSTEQAFGDAIQFGRFIPLLAERGAKVILLSHLLPLNTLLASLPGLSDVIVPGKAIPACTWGVPMLSLPMLLGTTLETLPASVPYLFPNKECIEAWRKRLQGDENLKIGIAWSGREKPDPRRSSALEQFSPCATIPGISWYSLQVGGAREQAAEAPPGMLLHDLTTDIGNFEDTAALMTNLDLIITIDSAVAHLSGALGRQTWVLLPFAPDWRWMLRRDDSPWYPTMRLFRQQSPGDWGPVFAMVASRLRAMVTVGGD